MLRLRRRAADRVANRRYVLTSAGDRAARRQQHAAAEDGRYSQDEAQTPQSKLTCHQNDSRNRLINTPCVAAVVCIRPSENTYCSRIRTALETKDAEQRRWAIGSFRGCAHPMPGYRRRMPRHPPSQNGNPKCPLERRARFRGRLPARSSNRTRGHGGTHLLPTRWRTPVCATARI